MNRLLPIRALAPIRRVPVFYSPSRRALPPATAAAAAAAAPAIITGSRARYYSSSSTQSGYGHADSPEPQGKQQKGKQQQKQALPEEEASAASGGSRSKEAVETGSSPTAGSIPKSGSNPESGSGSNSYPTGGPGILPDTLASGDARGRTGGGEPLASSHHPPPQPKISNASVPGSKPNLTKEQQEEVDQHNREFEAKHGRGSPAEDDKVNKSFWSGTGDRQVNN